MFTRGNYKTQRVIGLTANVYYNDGGATGKEPPANAGEARDAGSNPGSGRSPGGGHSSPLQYSSLDNPMDRGTWWATAHGVTKSQTQLKQVSTHTQ